jgi:hypothetical protein
MDAAAQGVMDAPPSTRRRRQRSTVTTVVATAAVGYGTYRLAQWAWNSARENKQEQEGEALEQLRVSTVPTWRYRRLRMTQCRSETIHALEGFLSTLRGIIEKETDSSQARKMLKSMRAAGHERDSTTVEKERELWEAFKVYSMTQMIATAYSMTLLFLILTVQVHLLAGQQDTRDTNHQQQATHEQVLQRTYSYFFEQRGLLSLIHAVERAVREVLADWDVQTSLHVPRERVKYAIQQIRTRMEESRYRPRSLMRFLMPPPTTQDETVQSLLDATFDVLESPVLIDAQQDALNATFDILCKEHWGTLFEAEDPDEPATKPLATILARLNKSSKSFYDGTESSSSSSYSRVLETLPSVLELGDVSFG